MSRNWYINGEALVAVRSGSHSAIAVLSQLGLSISPIEVSPTIYHKDLTADAWGGAPADAQCFLAECAITMDLVHFDPAVLDVCVGLGMGGPTQNGMVSRAGTKMGGGVTRFGPGNNFIGLNITSPQEGRPWRFFNTYLTGTPMVFPLGTERSAVRLTWRAIPYVLDPWGNGLGSTDVAIWDRTLDT